MEDLRKMVHSRIGDEGDVQFYIFQSKSIESTYQKRSCNNTRHNTKLTPTPTPKASREPQLNPPLLAPFILA